MIPAQFNFTIPEIVSLIGLAQCVYVLVYIFLRSGDMARAMLPIIYFGVLACGFFLDFAAQFIGSATDYYEILQWLAWFSGPPLSVLLLVQIAQIGTVPPLKNYAVLLLIPAALFAAVAGAKTYDECIIPAPCDVLNEWLVVCGLLAGLLSMILIWNHRSLIDPLRIEKSGRDRYWLVVTLIAVNLLFLAAMLLGASFIIPPESLVLIRNFLGLGFVYLAGTSLFRIYPRAVRLVDRAAKGMDDEDRVLAGRINDLIDMQKIYHEAAYSRADMARELGVPESAISKVVSLHYGKTLPQVLNERRVDDAKRMLSQTEAQIAVIATESGFNSLASFNRVFREITGMTPSAYRAGDGKAS